jgi:hypothetical protein
MDTDYETLREDFRRISRTNGSKVANVLGYIGLTLVGGCFGLWALAAVVGQWRYVLLGLVALLAGTYVSSMAGLARTSKVYEQLGDLTWVKKILEDDAVVVDGADLSMVVDVAAPQMDPARVPNIAARVAYDRLSNSVELWKTRAVRKRSSR